MSTSDMLGVPPLSGTSQRLSNGDAQPPLAEAPLTVSEQREASVTPHTPLADQQASPNCPHATSGLVDAQDTRGLDGHGQEPGDPGMDRAVAAWEAQGRHLQELHNRRRRELPLGATATESPGTLGASVVPSRAPLGPRLARRQEPRRLLVAGTGGRQEWPTGEQGEPTAGRQEVQGALLADEGQECGEGGQQGVTNAGLPEKVLTRQPSRLAEGQLGLSTDVQRGLFVKEPWERVGQGGRPVREKPQVLAGTQHGLSVAEELEAGEISSLNPFPRIRPGTSLGGQVGTEEQAFLFRSVQCLQPATVQGGVYRRGRGRDRGRSGTTQRGRLASQQEQQSGDQCEQHSGVQHEQRQQDSRQGRQSSALRKQCVERQQGRRVE
ncbi:unnamed protein product [Closterium sp. NIES-53]